MILSLDTHAFLWWLQDPDILSVAARKAIADGSSIVFVSAAVIWEITIKRSLGKLDAPENVEEMMDINRFRPLPVTIPHVIAVRNLPDLHRDPFDRLLIAQAAVEGCKFVTRDSLALQYGLPHIVA